MNLTFAPLMTVMLTHDYFASGMAEGLDVRPTPRCQRLMTDGGLLMRRTGPGFVVLYQKTTEGGDAMPLKPLSWDEPLTFVLAGASPHFLQFSDLPLDHEPGRHLFYFSTESGHVHEGGLRLSADAPLHAVSQSDRILLMPRVFDYTIDHPAAAGTITVWDRMDAIVLSKQVATQAGRLRCGIDLSHLPPARYTLFLDGAARMVFYADETLTRDRPLGVIAVYNDGRVAEPFRLSDASGAARPKTFRIHFGNRRAFWHYQVHVKYRRDIDPEDLTITHSEIGFTRQPAAIAPDGSTTVSFISNGELPLRQSPVKGIALGKTGGNGTRLKINHLQNPTGSQIRQAGDRVFSDLHVYI